MYFSFLFYFLWLWDDFLSAQLNCYWSPLKLNEKLRIWDCILFVSLVTENSQKTVIYSLEERKPLFLCPFEFSIHVEHNYIQLNPAITYHLLFCLILSSTLWSLNWTAFLTCQFAFSIHVEHDYIHQNPATKYQLLFCFILSSNLWSLNWTAFLSCDG